MRTAFPAALTIACVLLASCSKTQPSADAVPVDNPAPSATPTVAPAAAPRVGRAQVLESRLARVEVTVLRLRRHFTPGVPLWQERKGYIYSAIEAKVCLTRVDASAPSVSWEPWSLAWDSGIVAEEARSYGSDWWREPLFPQDHILKEGRCARGWIPFEVRAKDGAPGRVLFTLAGGASLEWRVAS